MTSNLGRLAAVLAITGALGACKAVGPNFQSPAAPTAGGYGMSGDVATREATLTAGPPPAGAWWKNFGSPDLDDVMRQALAGNPNLAAATATLQRARQQAAAVRGAQLPQADLNASGQRERINIASFGFTGFPNPTINLFSIGGTVTYDLDIFGGRRRQTEQAVAQADAEARRADAAYLTLTGNVALQAMQIASLRAQLATLDTVVDEDRQSIAMVKRAEAAGGESPSATVSGNAQLAADEALAPPLRQELAQARHQLALLVGKSPAEWTAPDFDFAALKSPAVVPVSLPSELVRRRPDILAAEADLHAATADIGVQTANLYPDIRLSANLTQSALSPLSLFSYGASGWSVGAGLTQPLFHGGTLKANKRAAEAEARAALSRYQETVLVAFVQVSDVLQAIAHDDEEVAALQRAESAAAANLKDNRAAYSLGGGALLPVIDAQRQLSNAQRALVSAQGRRMGDLVQLYTATAADWRNAPSAS